MTPKGLAPQVLTVFATRHTADDGVNVRALKAGRDWAWAETAPAQMRGWRGP